MNTGAIRDSLKILSNGTHLKARVILKEFSIITCSANSQSQSDPYDYLYIFFDDITLDIGY